MRRRYVGAGLVALAVAVTLGGCGGGSSASTSTAGPSVVVRGCSMVGSGGLAAGYRRRALIFGPLALGNLRSYTAHQPLPPTLHGRRGAYEVIAIVKIAALRGSVSRNVIGRPVRHFVADARPRALRLRS